jgi:hypothetical protein
VGQHAVALHVLQLIREQEVVRVMTAAGEQMQLTPII